MICEVKILLNVCGGVVGSREGIFIHSIDQR